MLSPIEWNFICRKYIMKNQIIFLTEQDKAILRAYLHIAEGNAEFWGESCKVIIHNLAQPNTSIIKIINGRHK